MTEGGSRCLYHLMHIWVNEIAFDSVRLCRRFWGRSGTGDGAKKMERLGLTKDKTKDKKKGTTTDAVGDRWNAEGVSIMEIEYKKRGSVREWDLGKEGF